MDNLIILEYKKETGRFHHNMVINKSPQSKPNENGWEAIAFTHEDKASLFCNIMNCKLHRREVLNLPPYNAEFIRKEWKHFCYVYNFIICMIETIPDQKEYIKRHFNEPEALARLGNGHFSDLKEDKSLSWAWEYDSLNYNDSNF